MFKRSVFSKKYFQIFICIGLLWFYSPTFAQTKEKKNIHLATDADKKKKPLSIDKNIAPTITLIPMSEIEEKEKEEPSSKKKKRKKRSYYGIKIKRKYIKKRLKNLKIEILFSIVKNKVEAPKYRPSIYFYNKIKKKIERTSRTNSHKHTVLHGHYLKKINDIAVEEGYYYKGVRHGRWEVHNKKNILIGKKIYIRGFLKESKISYYDPEKMTIKEVIPINYEKKDGIYLKYYENGRIQEKGLYRDGYKIGNWYEYYNKKRHANKKIIRYPKKPYYSENENAVVLKAWDKRGKKINLNND